MAVAQWEIRSHLRSLTFLSPSANLAIELPTQGWGAFLVRIGSKVCSVFISGSISERSPRVWNEHRGDSNLVQDAYRQGHCEISLTESGWRCHNALSGAELFLDNAPRDFRLVDSSGQVKARLTEVYKVLQLAPPEPPAPALEPSVSAAPTLTRQEEQGDDASISRVISPPPDELAVEPEPVTPFEVHSKVHGHLLFTVPLPLKDRETKLIHHLAKYGFVTREDLKRLLGRRAETITADLANRLHEADYPVIRITETQNYEFVAPE